MAKEIERKFLVRGDGWRQAVTRVVAIEQFYLARDDDRTVRVRIEQQNDATLTLKFGGSSLARDEYGYPIPLADAHEMRGFALGTIIVKRRHIVPFQAVCFEIDVFEGAHRGLVLAELEDAPDIAPGDLPDWVGREVTGDPRYYNAWLAGTPAAERSA